MTDLPGWLAASHAAANPRANTQSAAGRLSQPRPVPYRNAAPRPLPRTMRPADVRANDPQLAQSERDIARRELQRGDTLGRLADMGAAQSAPDPIHTPLQSNVIAGSRMVLPGAYDAGNAAGRIARGEDAWGDLALNTTMAALPFLGVRGMRGEPAPMPEPLPRYGANDRGLLERLNAIRTGGDDLSLPASPGFVNTEVGHPQASPDANAARPVQASDGNAASGRAALRPPGPGEYDVFHGTAGEFDQFDPIMRGSLRPGDHDAGQAFFFTSSPRVASEYADEAAGAAAPRNASADPAYNAAQNDMRDAMRDRHSRILPWSRNEALDRFYAASARKQDVLQNNTVGANVRPARIRLSNPLIVEGVDYDTAHFKRAIQEAREAGNDGVIWRSAVDTPSGARRRSDVYAVFDQSGIRPRFDPEHLVQSPNANAPPPPDRTPKSLPRRKPPNGGFFMPRGNP